MRWSRGKRPDASLGLMHWGDEAIEKNFVFALECSRNTPDLDDTFAIQLWESFAVVFDQSIVEDWVNVEGGVENRAALAPSFVLWIGTQAYQASPVGGLAVIRRPQSIFIGYPSAIAAIVAAHDWVAESEDGISEALKYEQLSRAGGEFWSGSMKALDVAVVEGWAEPNRPSDSEEEILNRDMNSNELVLLPPTRSLPNS